KKGSFGAGADVSWLPELAARPDAAEFLAGVHDLMLRVVRSPKPVVAALNGAAFGGALELVLAAHAIVAVPEAVVGLPEVTLELLPGGGGTQLLGRWVATEDWVELLVSGKRLNADQARDRGLVTEVVAAEACWRRPCGTPRGWPPTRGRGPGAPTTPRPARRWWRGSARSGRTAARASPRRSNASWTAWRWASPRASRRAWPPNATTSSHCSVRPAPGPASTCSRPSPTSNGAAGARTAAPSGSASSAAARWARASPPPPCRAA